MKWSEQNPLDPSVPAATPHVTSARPKGRLTGLPGIGRLWLWLGLVGASSTRGMAHRDRRAAESARRMAHQARRSGYKPRAAAGATVIVDAVVPASAMAAGTGSESGGSSVSFLSIFQRQLAPGEPRRREMLAILALLLVASLTSVAATATGFGSSPTADDAAIGETASPDQTWAASVDFVETVAPGYSITPTPKPTPTPRPTPKPKPKATPIPLSKQLKFVALGDSLTAWPLTYNWPHCTDVNDQKARLVNNAGVAGDTTADMRARFNRDVLAYKPDFLLVMGGTNDIGSQHNIPTAETISNLRAIVRAAKAHKIKVVLLEIPPQSSAGQSAKARSLNAAIVHLANSEKIYYVDSYSPLAMSSGVIKAAYTWDGLHLTIAGAQKVGNAVWYRLRRIGL